MCDLRCRVRFGALVAVCAALAAARAHPAPREPVPRLDLEQVLGRTVCPLAVRVDEDPLRLPRRIKFLACAAAAPACCLLREPRGRRTQCVEVYDKVVVQYLSAEGADPRDATQAVIRVPVGCACVLQTPAPLLQDE